jgi:ubiquinone biosynthesis protein COQ4
MPGAVERLILVYNGGSGLGACGPRARRGALTREGDATVTIQPGRALRAVAALSRNPDDTAQVFALIEALSGVRTPRWIVRRLAATPDGSRLLRERPEIVAHLSDRATLRRLPVNSVAHAYLRFVDAEGITAEGLRVASAQGERRERAAAADVEFIRARMRDTHDLWHAVLGYGGDVLGEAALLAFTFAQTRNAAIGTLVLVGLAKLDSREARALIINAFGRGVRAAWLPGQPWEELLPLPIDEIRQRLRIGAPPRYTPVRSSELRAGGLLQETAGVERSYDARRRRPISR